MRFRCIWNSPHSLFSKGCELVYLTRKFLGGAPSELFKSGPTPGGPNPAGGLEPGSLAPGSTLTLLTEAIRSLTRPNVVEFNFEHSINTLGQYSHLSNKRGAHAYLFWKIPPSLKQKSTLLVFDFLDFSTLHSSFIRFYVLIFSKNSTLLVYSKLHV